MDNSAAVFFGMAMQSSITAFRIYMFDYKPTVRGEIINACLCILVAWIILKGAT